LCHRKGKERKGEERKGKERKGKEMKGKERKSKLCSRALFKEIQVRNESALPART
jgi:hypothetical protein